MPLKHTNPSEFVRLNVDAATVQTPEWQMVMRIVASPGFVKSALLSNFLLYVCERKLQNREGEIIEQQIGVHAFGRAPAYNPGDDNIVRNYARILRQRLDQFYAEEGRDERLRVTIPRGSYVPHFHEQAARLYAPFDEPLPVVVATPPAALLVNPGELPASWRRWFTGYGRLAALAIAILSGLALLAYGVQRVWTVMHPDAYTELWNEVLDPHRPAVVVLADSGIGLLQDLTGERIHLHEYASGDISKVASALARRYPNAAFGADRYKNLTSTADVQSLLDLVKQPQFGPSAPLVRYAHDVQMDDLAHANLIIVGGPRANPWVELYEPLSGFRIEVPDEIRGFQLDGRIVRNKAPQHGEASTYSSANSEEGHVNHSILSFLPSLDGQGHTLMFQGGNMGATQAAADFATDRLSMKPILERARREDGSLRPFELLLETRVVGASSPKATVLLTHYGD